MAFIPNKIKMSNTYEPGCVISNSMLLGIDEAVTFGPTSTTGFWAGITPQPAGWTVYLTKVSQGPSIYNTTDIVDSLNQISGLGSITNMAQAYDWIYNQGDKIAVYRDYPSLRTDGLRMAFDTSFPPCWNTSNGNNNAKDIGSSAAPVDANATWLESSINASTHTMLCDNTDFNGNNNIQGMKFNGSFPIQTISLWIKTYNQPSADYALMDSLLGEFEISSYGGLGSAFVGASINVDNTTSVAFTSVNQAVMQDTQWHNIVITLSGAVTSGDFFVGFSRAKINGLRCEIGEVYAWSDFLDNSEVTDHWNEFKDKYGL
jgi:hypothetical protein